MNGARLVKDEKDDIYLLVYGTPLDDSIYFKVELWATKPVGKITDLTKQSMIVNLTGGK